MVVLLVCEVGDCLSWFLLFEISMLAILSGFFLEGRSFRRAYAFLILTAFSCLSVSFFLLGLGGSKTLLNSFNVDFYFLILLLTFLVKTPVFPFSFWLTEAHVEGSHLASIQLAAFAMKFSTFAVLIFTAVSVSNFDVVFLLPIFAWFSGALGSGNSSDAKKISAALSIFHLAWGLFIFLKTSQKSEAQNNLIWSHHSVVASLNFFWIGICYSFSGSRNSKNMCGPQNAALTCLIFMVIALFILDFPISFSFLFEYSVCGFINYSGLTLAMPVFLFGASFFFLLVLKINNSRELKFISKDSSSLVLFLILVSSAFFWFSV